MKILVWQWGRFGAGPRVAMELAEAFRRLPATGAALSLASGAELMQLPDPPLCELPVDTYKSFAGLLGRIARAPWLIASLTRRIEAIAPDAALCAMPGPLDLVMARALRRAGVPVSVMIHDADRHPGDGFPFQMGLQRRLAGQADALVALTGHVASRLRDQGLVGAHRRLIMTTLPPLVFGATPAPPRRHGGRLRLLSFGRLLPYKGLDLLAGSLARLADRTDIECRVIGSGPESEALDQLRAVPFVTVENRWVAETEIGALLAWSDALVLSHREASQSGVAAAAIAARRLVIATRVGGLVEQLQGERLARLCEPDAASIAAAIVGLAAEAPPAADEIDPMAAWLAMAGGLAGALPRK